jgi:hypothetical protein
MTRLLHYIIAVALTGITSINLAFGSSTPSSNASSPASPASGIEIDVIFPIYNATYNITKSLPIVFALQNLTAAAALGPFTFIWDIMPWGNIGEKPVPGGVLNDECGTTFTSVNATTYPYILVNQTDVQKWQFGPYYPDSSVYALQYGIQWDTTDKVCDSDPLDVQIGTLFFNINIGSPEPDLEILVGQRPQLGRVSDINTTVKNSSCSAVVSNSGTGDPCAITMDKAMVGGISSSVQSLITALAIVVSASISATAIHSPVMHSISVSPNVPSRYAVVVVFLLWRFQIIMFS